MNDDQPPPDNDWWPIVAAFQFLAKELRGLGTAALNLRDALAAGYVDALSVNDAQGARFILPRVTWDAPGLSDAGHPFWVTGELNALGDGLAEDEQSRTVLVRYLQIMNVFRVGYRGETFDDLARISGRIGAGGDRHVPSISDLGGINKAAAIREPWTAARMRDAIAQCDYSNRDQAWREMFKPLQSDHGWKAQSFRDEWSTARGTKGHRGRLPT